ncbi:4-alpha-glucanotransferase [Sphingobium sp. BHU LFT2]|uniref:4-alpha-glucanotransferase n=1 Tax=Sphingobium sp. BHU LFT2 TaxID=2807634 RepID=UPI001BE804F9|nr:4-alpha-glucanotransferase [Sphingobium sp. BHU LFT2]MBT2245111.1 4-alpha-glucanotransferase [Sphingobium sp. BHU LFT2]
MRPLHQLAKEAGISRRWTNADGVEQIVSDDSLRAILAALGLSAGDDEAVKVSRATLHQRRSARPKLVTVDYGEPLPLPSGEFTLRDERGTALEIDPDHGVSAPGYYCAEFDGGSMMVAVAPPSCPAIRTRGWGVTVQIPSLREEGKDFGDFDALMDAVLRLSACGADAIALSPVHAQSLLAPGDFAPYSPSSRIALNALLVPVDARGVAPSATLIDWEVAGPAKLKALEQAFMRAAPEGNTTFDAGNFEAFLQEQARTGLDAIQRAAKEAGMAVGVITDLAVGVDPQGEDARKDPGAFLQGLRIGAPPDPLGPRGQDWGLTGYSPQGLEDRGFAPFIALLRANMPRGGGMRIDHGFGLQRLWVIPEGRPAAEGAYLSYPFPDMLRLLKLEAWRAGSIVIAEDLGTRPTGFDEALERANIYGMTVLPFARDDEGFLPASDYPERSVAMSGTHDIATIAGWWTGRDLDWNRRLDRGGETRAQRAKARLDLWTAIGAGAPQPDDADTAPVIERALTFLAGSAAPLLLVPMEDLMGLIEQPNLPGTTIEHPNWRRRLPAPLERLLADADVQRRIACLTKGRQRNVPRQGKQQ